MTERSRRREFRIVLRLFFGGCVILIAALALEVSERVGQRLDLEGEPGEQFVRDEAIDSEVTLFEDGNRRYRRNAVVNFRGQEYRTNSRGFRAPEYTIPKPEGRLRIVCIGASTTVEGPTNEWTYPALLERNLRARLNSEDVEVVNCGVAGIDIQEQVANLEYYLKEDPDAVVELCGVNDICWNLFPEWKAEGSFLARAARNSLFLTNHFNSYVMPPKERIQDDLEMFTVGQLRLMSIKFSQAGVGMAICTLPCPDLRLCTEEERDFFDLNLKIYWRGSFLTIESYCDIVSMHNRNIEEFARELSMLIVPLDGELRGGRDIFTDICHLTEEGIALKAEIVARYLEGAAAKRLKSIHGAE